MSSLHYFGRYLRDKRDELKRQQSEVAADLCMTQSAYSKYESGNIKDISADTLKKICEVLKLDYVDSALRLANAKFNISEPDRINSSVDDAKWGLITAIYSRKSKIVNLNEIDDETKTEMIASEIRAHTKLLMDKIVLDVPGLEVWESKLQGENNFWIASEHLFDNPGNKFFDSLVKQLKSGSRYTFFIPKNLIWSNFSPLKEEIKRAMKCENDPNVRAVPLPQNRNNVMREGTAYIIANPTSHKRKFGFSCRINDEDLPMIAYEIDDHAILGMLRDYLIGVAMEHADDDAELINHITRP